jgi:hypothetical protein
MEGLERMMCGQTMETTTSIIRSRVASRLLLTVGAFGARNL